ncbi:MAG: S8 family serine peptidase, partial [Candidatus Korarchaeota archaeon]|nr:S8 family serine peptidase [Candidatus Korarchaeota archaeon]NIU84535.1 S8 family serine peptidase [Candidatus Thorarchaeota archaeon]NIW14602.1 S8 family serine peptidase [Candidatus Thorarchaeota archaeon]NIW52674.1 S8 family serine peptidase [Candidatus Korarchaeota archaeon]
HYSNGDPWGYSVLDDSIEPNTWDDDTGHGTHCAGIIAAVDNAEGILGVSPNVDIYPIKVAEDENGDYKITGDELSLDDVATGVIKAMEGPDGENGTDDDADIISMSFGKYEENSALSNAVFEAWNRGIVLVAAAGNDGRDLNSNKFYPACYEGVISVGATDDTDTQWLWSNDAQSYPNKKLLELVAPGVDINSTIPSGYGEKTGTSMAAPHVTGTAALVMAEDLEDGLRDLNVGGPSSEGTDTIRGILHDSAKYLDYEGRYGYGRVDVAAAVDMVPDVDHPHDLAVTVMDAPSEVAQGEEARIEVTVKNQGDFEETSTLTLKDTYDGDEIGDKTVELSPGSSETYVFWWDTTGEALGGHTLKATVDEVTGETDTADNTKEKQIEVVEPEVHDLAITKFDAYIITGFGLQTATAKITVENQGDFHEDSTLTIIDMYGDGDSDSTSVSLDAGKSKTYDFQWDVTGQYGTHILEASVDEVTGETDTADNTKTETITN